jgi:hypothetical protein
VKKTTNLAPKTGSRARWPKVGIVGAALALAVSVTPLLGTSADAALDTPGFCMKATGFDGSFEGAAGGKACEPSPVVKPVAVADLITVSYTAPLGKFARVDYGIFATDDLTKETRQVGDLSSGPMIYLSTSGKSAGWTFELRAGDEAVARAKLLPASVKEVDEGGWVHGDASLAFKPLPITVDLSTSLYAELENSTGTPTVEDFGWKISDQRGKTVDQGTGKTSAGSSADKIRISKTVVVEQPAKIAELSSGELPKWSVSYTYRGETYTVPLTAFDLNLSDETQAVKSPTHLQGYNLSTNGTRLLLRAGDPTSTDRIRAELY